MQANIKYAPTMFAPQRPIIKHLAVGLDFDGCTNTRQSREMLSDDIVNYVMDHPAIEKIDIIISSLRQSLLLDAYNADYNPLDEQGRSQSCTAITEGFIESIQSKLELLFTRNRIQRPIPTIEFEPLLIADIFDTLPAGTHFEKMEEFKHYTKINRSKRGYVQVKNHFDQIFNIAQYNSYTKKLERANQQAGFEFADTSKLLILWVQMQYFSGIYGAKTPYIFRFVDDRRDLLESVEQFYSVHTELFPDNCRLETMYMSSNYRHYPPQYGLRNCIFGSGQLHQNYNVLCNQMARTLAALCPRAGMANEQVVGDVLVAQVPKPSPRHCPIPNGRLKKAIQPNHSPDSVVYTASGCL